MKTGMSEVRVLTLGRAADRLGCAIWQIRRLFERGILPPAPRVGPYRVIAVSDLPSVAAALREAGYLSDEPEVTHGNQ